MITEKLLIDSTLVTSSSKAMIVLFIFNNYKAQKLFGLYVVPALNIIQRENIQYFSIAINWLLANIKVFKRCSKSQNGIIHRKLRLLYFIFVFFVLIL